MEFFNKNRKLIIPGVIVALLIGLPIVWWLASPLFINNVVDEEFPFELPSTAELDAMSDDEKMEVIEEGVAAVMEMADDENLDPAMEQKLEDTLEELAAAMPDKEMEEEMPEAADVWAAVSNGNFVGADQFHQADGSAAIFQQGDNRILRFEDFEVTNGPDLHVLLVENLGGTSHSTLGEYVDLGPLKGNIGAQNYEIPADIDLSQYEGVLIYCMPFHVVFGTASLSGN